MRLLIRVIFSIFGCQFWDVLHFRGGRS
jgi:hypothetical protein